MSLNLKPYASVLSTLEETSEITVESLTELLRVSPEAIDVLELILQLSNFTTAQRTFLMFDIARLNSPSVDESLRYILEVLSQDDTISESFNKKGLFESLADVKLDQFDDHRKRVLLAESKRVIAELCEKRDTTLLRHRMKVSASVRRRAAEYLIRRRALPKVLAGVHPRTFLENKRIPVDTKSAHGKYAARIIEGILVAGGFQYHEGLKSQIPRGGSSQQLLGEQSDSIFYCKEREVESFLLPGVSISSESAPSDRKKAKRFDFVLFRGNVPKVVIETNFYTTSGTKIGINETEYVALHRQLAQSDKRLRFIWITDGSYWLTRSGKRNFLKLAPAFNEDLLNLAMFADRLPSIKCSMERDKPQ